MIEAVEESLRVFPDKEAWRALMRNGMGQDFSWKKPAKEYEALYTEVARRRS
jgi:starch synthase